MNTLHTGLIIGCSLLLLVSCAKKSTEMGEANIGTPDGVNTSTIPVDAPRTSGPAAMNYEDVLSKISPEIKGAREFQECMSPSVNMCETSVGMRMAQEKKDAALCDNLSNTENKNSCKSMVLTMISREKKDITLCDQIDGPGAEACRAQYIRSEAVEKKDPKLCKSLEKKGGSGSVEGPAWSTSIDQCVYEVTMQIPEANIEDCDLIQEGPMLQMCKMSIEQRKRMRELAPATPAPATPAPATPAPATPAP